MWGARGLVVVSVAMAGVFAYQLLRCSNSVPLPLTESAKIISHPRLHRLDGVFMCLCASAPVTLAWKRQEISQVGQHVHVLLFGGDGGELLLRDCSHKRGAKPFRINRFRDVLAAPHLFFFGHSRGHAERVMHRPKSRRFISLSSSPPPGTQAANKLADAVVEQKLAACVNIIPGRHAPLGQSSLRTTTCCIRQLFNH
jgi:hypothetical protein